MRRYKRKFYRKKRYFRRPAVSKVARRVKTLNRKVLGEKFMLDQSNVFNVLNTGNVVVLTNIAQGDTSSGRTGNTVLIKSLFGRISFVINASVSVSVVRMVIVRDSQQISDTTPAVTDLLESASVFSPLSSTTKGRFKVLYDRMISLDSAKNAQVLRKFNVYVNKTARYNGTASTDIQKGGLYMMFISDQATYYPVCTYDVRTSYHDN